MSSVSAVIQEGSKGKKGGALCVEGGKKGISAFVYNCPCDCEGLVDSRDPKRHKCTSGKHGDTYFLFGGCCLYDPEQGWNGFCQKCGREAFDQKNRYTDFFILSQLRLKI